MQNEMDRRQETVEIPLGRLHRFPHHPYKVQDNEEMEALTESIREYGILSPSNINPQLNNRTPRAPGCPIQCPRRQRHKSSAVKSNSDCRKHHHPPHQHTQQDRLRTHL